MKLYTYWRSSAAYRVRIGLNLKGLSYNNDAVHLVNNGGEQLSAAYRAINPQMLVPSLELNDGHILTQSLAILEYLDETVKDHPFLPESAIGRANARALAHAIAMDIHPINNLRVLKFLESVFSASAELKSRWYRHWIQVGFSAFEAQLEINPTTGDYCMGDKPGLADICLVPQIYNAQRFNVDMNLYPTMNRINENCITLDAFSRAAPEVQPDSIV